MRWFNLNTGIIILVIIIILVAIGVGIVGYSLWNVTKAKELFPFLEISEVFPTKAIALFTGLATFGTLVLALATILTIKNNNEQEKRRREDERRRREEEIERDFKRRCLNDIQDWADKGINVFVSWPAPIGQSEMRQIRPDLKPLSALNKWVMDASRIFAGDDKKALLKKVDEAAENLKQYCEVLEGKLSSEGMAQRHDQCPKSFTEVLERIADVKVKLQL